MYNCGHTFELGVPIYTVVYLKNSVTNKLAHTHTTTFCLRTNDFISECSGTHYQWFNVKY